MSQTIIVTWTTVTETDYKLVFETDNPANIINILEDGHENVDPETWLGNAEETSGGSALTVEASRTIERKNIQHTGNETWPEVTKSLIEVAGALCIDLDLSNPQNAEYLRAQVELIADAEYVERFHNNSDDKREALEAAILYAAASFGKH